MDLDMSQLGKRPWESMRKFESQSNATEQVVGRVHLDRVAACLDKSMWCSCESRTGREEEGSSSSHCSQTRNIIMIK